MVTPSASQEPSWALPVIVGVPLLVVTYRRFALTPLAYVLIWLHAIILLIGGHYTYAEVPLFNWLRDTLAWYKGDEAFGRSLLDAAVSAAQRLGAEFVDEDNTRTKYVRDKTRTWYYQTLDPCLEPPDENVPHRGEYHRLGTRYHYDDLYGHLISNELKAHHQIIPALDARGRSPWPEKYPPKWFAEKRGKSGLIIFNAQYQCDTEAMKGEIFQYDDCQIVDEDDIPGDLRVFMGIDLAISQKEKADKFAIVVLGLDSTDRRYVLDYYENQLRFNQQTAKILDAPLCYQCGSKMQPAGSCYVCTSCGATSGCS